MFFRPRGPPGAFKCFETTHLYHECPLRRQVGAINQDHQLVESSQPAIDQNEILTLEQELAAVQMVSVVTFPFIDNRCDSNVKLNLHALFDIR